MDFKICFVSCFSVLCCVLFFDGVVCVTNFQENFEETRKNIITRDERRGADSFLDATNSQDVRGDPRSRFYVPPTYEGTGVGTSSFGSNPNSYLPPYHTPPTGGGSSSFGSTHGYGFYPDTGFNTVRGPSGHGTVTPSTGYGSFSLKGLLIPLAGIALLGAAAALSTNPVLLQLGVLNGRRRKRSLESLDGQQIAFSKVKPQANDRRRNNYKLN